MRPHISVVLTLRRLVPRRLMLVQKCLSLSEVKIMTSQRSVFPSLQARAWTRASQHKHVSPRIKECLLACVRAHTDRSRSADRQSAARPRTSFLWQAHTGRPDDTSAHTRACSRIDIKHLTHTSMRAITRSQTHVH